MWAFLVTLLLVVVVALAIVGAAALLTRRRRRLAHEELDEHYTYRKEPHADQVAEHPNRLSENEITDADNKS